MSAQKKADIILTGNAVFTGVSNRPSPASIAIVDNKIAGIGAENEMESFIGPNTKSYQFNDHLIMPGFHDFHLHIMMGSILENGVHLSAARSEDEAVQMVSRYSEAHQEEEWIIGVGWDASYWNDKQQPHRSSLDRVVSDRPILLYHAEMHYAWVNSKALEICNINQFTENPSYGYINRDENGIPTGILYEEATGLIEQKAFAFSKEKERDLFKKFLELSAHVGITSVNDMYGGSIDNDKYYDLFKEFEEKDELTTRIHILPSIDKDLESAKQLRNKYTSDKLQFSGLKGFIDGVITSRTAYLVGPYADDSETCGELVYSPEVIKNKVVEADREGFRIRFHAIGDGAVRLALDAFEEAQKANGKKDIRHTIEHVEVIHPEDIFRFQELDVIASMQPELMAQSERENYASLIGKEKEPFVFPVNTLMGTGATVTLGTDFPVAPLNPLLEIYRAVTRMSSDGRPWHAYEGISLAEALKGYTMSPAYGTFREHELGTLEIGKLADITVLDRNLFEVPVEEIRDAKVRLTMVDGKVVYDHSEGLSR
ncbi:amidohydrolase [Alteribacillus bidgolensis]|uniref:Amidohydrolase 3 domain-containing protein n=1 Tax=Alteribacillus bidgolensis TaxID=930129 RepID=A0A1G8MQ55_9BACI|nr:amidohydrolase [Alteribacillus bidgolensis]SDI70044.1 hypothetical protein SAMN05216352_110142 [Alteribacillus bidgolensis]